MNCAWDALLAILPTKIRTEVDKLGKETLQELRLRLGCDPELICADSVRYLHEAIQEQDLQFVVNTASRYSPWMTETFSRGYITAEGGHRIGICGQAVVTEGRVSAIRSITSVNIRVARDFPNIAKGILVRENILILGPPGSGKTTLVRDLARQLAEKDTVTVVDEREELFPVGFSRGKRMDVLTGCPKGAGIDMALRTMGASWIVLDEISSKEDCDAMGTAGWCGVGLIATAHAADKTDLFRRELYRPLVTSGLFTRVMIFRRDKTWYWERLVEPCSGSLAPV